MFSVLIVDDEEPVLDSYSFMLEDGSEGFTLAGKARSGFEALRLIHELRPDVVFMDINMPGLDGLEVLSQIHGQFPSTLFILSTAYERFDLARRAIPLGVFAYLVKPVGRRQFSETLASVRAELLRRNATQKPADGALLARTFLRDTIWKPFSRPEWEALRDALGLTSDSAIPCFLLIDSDDEARFDAVEERLSLRYRLLSERYLDLAMVLVCGEVAPEALAADVHSALAACLPRGTLSLAGIGPLQSGPGLFESCAAALASIRAQKKSTGAGVRERLGMLRIRRGMGIEDQATLGAAFEAWWRSIFSAADFSLAKAKMIAFFTLLSEDARKIRPDSGEGEDLFEAAEEIAALRTADEWEKWAERAFEDIYADCRRGREGSCPVPLVRALDFIDRGFAEQIRLPDAAEAGGISAAYLSRLFSEHLGTTFVDYLTERRIHEAERLIRSGHLSIKEISFAVGCQDPNYFSKIFRKSAGISPSMYAQRERYDESKPANAE